MWTSEVISCSAAAHTDGMRWHITSPHVPTRPPNHCGGCFLYQYLCGPITM